MHRYHIFLIPAFVLFAGCIAADNARMIPSKLLDASPDQNAGPTAIATIQPAITQEPDEKAHVSTDENRSVAVEVNYREYVDWFRNHNLNIRAYTPEEYVCGQYTEDMIRNSEKAGYRAYFAAVTFSDDTGHALVSFKSTVLGYTSWYFFEPQTNQLMTPETLAHVLNQRIGKTVTRVTIYGYFDDAGDKDPTTWQFAYPLYNRKY